MELLIGIVLCAVLSLWTRFYTRYVATDAARHKPFETWCRTRPLVVAFRCQPGTTVDVYEILRRYVEPPSGFLNTHGRYPWQHYAVQLDWKRLNDEVIGIFVTSSYLLRSRQSAPDLAMALKAFGRVAGERVEEVWLHGQFHSVNRQLSPEKERVSWLGSLAPNGEIEAHAMIGKPIWLTDTLDQLAA